MPKAKTPRATKAKDEKRVLQMPEVSGGSNGNGNGAYSTVDLESEIRLRAYELYEQRGYTDGLSEDDWLQAEREVLARHGSHAHTA
jgi:hypothetical protein